MRCFFAIELPSAIRSQIAAAIESLRRVEPGITWVGEENLHLTVKFLGEIEDSRAKAVAESLSLPLSLLPPFEIEGGPVGVFPPQGDPRVFWLGLSRGEGEMAALARAVEDALELLGFVRESQHFQAHLTVGRCREGVRLGPRFFERWCEFSGFRFGRARIDGLTLFQSQLRPEGPIYLSMRRLELGRRNA